MELPFLSLGAHTSSYSVHESLLKEEKNNNLFLSFMQHFSEKVGNSDTLESGRKGSAKSHIFVQVIIISDESSSVGWTPLKGSAQYHGSVH